LAVRNNSDLYAEADRSILAHKRKNVKNKIIALLVVLAIVGVGFAFCYVKLFKIKKIEVEGDCPYTAEEVLSGMGLEYGMGLYEKSEKEIKQNVKYSLSYINNIEVSRRWPSTVVAKVEKADPTFYISLDNNLYIISQSLRVLDKTDEIEKVEVDSLVLLRLDDIKNCIEGEFLGIDEDTEQTILELCTALEENGQRENITVIDVTDKFDISVMYKEKYLVKLGDRRNLNHKIQFMNAIIDRKKNDGTNGIIDVSDENSKEGTFKNF